ncbi:tetratricopeptide repeat protein [uncultured Tenacibaculum sp.]|uniref:tetratricopeptide repeat protein n=1 Tax=uncultured Tenacibaculum sp. TaxID=174713 RepID=UPI002614E712|nr:tetratricopeptide repeat protein [uncultured Tenacibaculum sp.]
MKTLALGFSIVFIIFYFNKATAQNKQIVDSLLQIVNTKSTDTTLIKAYNALGIQYASSNHFKAKKFIRKALRIAHKIKAHRGIAGSSNCLGIVYYYQKEYDSALVHFKKALFLNKKVNHLWGQASALHQIGAVQNFQSNYFEAIESFKQSGTLFLKLKDSISYIKSIENTGVSYLLMRHDKKSLEHLFKANKLYEKRGNPLGLGRTNIQISNVLIRQKEYSKALEFLEKALPQIIQGGNKIHLLVLLKNKGIALKGIKAFDRALEFYNQALKIARNINHNKRICALQSLIGDLYYERKQYEKAITIQKEALKNYPKSDYKDKSYTSIGLANSFLKLNKLDSAVYYAEGALPLSKKAMRLDLEKDAVEILAGIAEQKKDTAKSYTYFKQISLLKDSINAIEKQKQARELRAKFEFDKKERKIKTLTKINQQAKQKHIVLIIVSFLGIFLLSYFVLIFQRKQKQLCIEKYFLNKELLKKDEELQEKSKQLTSNSLHLANKNKALKALKKEVESIKYAEDQNTQYNYQKLLQTINFNMTEDKDWDNFKKYFEQLHNDFYSTIKNKYPSVTANELRLMALLKMNLSTKEIAGILNVTQEGVRKARYRLRKKLKIESNTMLLDMVLNI